MATPRRLLAGKDGRIFKIRKLFPTCLPALFLLASLLGVGRASPAQEPPKTEWSSYLPEGKGKELLQSLCTSCHDLSRVVQTRRGNPLWWQTVNGMVSGPDPQMAEYLKEEINVMARYLAEYLGPLSPSLEALQTDPELRKKYLSGQMKSLVNLNTGTVDELMQLPGIQRPMAEEIVKYRKERGLFQSVDDLRKVTGMDAADFDKIKMLLYVDSDTGESHDARP